MRFGRRAWCRPDGRLGYGEATRPRFVVLDIGDPRVGERVVYTADVAADEVSPLHVRDAPLEHQPANVADRDTEVLGDVFDRHQPGEFVARSVRGVGRTAVWLRCHGGHREPVTSRITTRVTTRSWSRDGDLDVGYYPFDRGRREVWPGRWEVAVLVEVGGGEDYPGDEVVESGRGELAGVVEMAQVVDHPRRVGR